MFPSSLQLTEPPNKNIGDKHWILLQPGAKPIKHGLYLQSPQEQLLIKYQLKEFLAVGEIQPLDSPWGSPVLFVNKPGRFLRFWFNFQALNKIMIHNQYLLPRLENW